MLYVLVPSDMGKIIHKTSIGLNYGRWGLELLADVELDFLWPVWEGRDGERTGAELEIPAEQDLET